MASRKIVKGDIVTVIAGDDKGKSGKVTEIIQGDKRTLAVVEGINIATVHRKPTNEKPGGRDKVAKPMDISNLSLMDSGKAARVGFVIETEDGKVKKSRVFKKTNKKVN